MSSWLSKTIRKTGLTDSVYGLIQNLPNMYFVDVAKIEQQYQSTELISLYIEI